MNKTLTINDLKNMGARYNIEHYRYSQKKNALLPLRYFRATKTQNDIMAKGGLTIASIALKDGTKYHAVSECMQIDSFRCSLGVSIALKRIQEQMDSHRANFGDINPYEIQKPD